MVADKRFRVESSDGVVKLYGFLSDSVKFAIFDEHVKGEFVKIDCQQLEGSTWNALVELDRVLKEKVQKVTLINLPYAFFRKFKYMPNFYDFYKVLSCEFQFYKPDTNELINHKIENPGESWDSVNDEFIQNDRGEILLGKKHYFLKDYPVEVPSFAEHGGFPTENYDELNFWIDYCSFYQSSIVLCQDLGACIRYNFAAIYDEVTRLVQDFLAIKIVDNTENQKLLEKLEREYGAADNMAEKLNTELVSISAETEKQIGTFLTALKQDKVTSKEEMEIFLTNIFNPTDHLYQISSLVEDIGSSLGQAILEFPVNDILDDVVKKLDSIDPKDEALEEVRETLKIMNPMTEDSWEETKEDVEEEMNHCQNQYFEFMTTVQGLDLLRQVLEHRFTEQQMIKQYLDADSIWFEISEKVIANVIDRAVTDQEKFTNRFYLDRFKKEEEEADSAPPGECLLF